MISYSTDHIEKRLSAFVGAPVFVASGALCGDESDYEQERELVRNAAPKRRAEFFTGRRLARQAMMRAELPPAPVLRGAVGNPLWPDGITGSISHGQFHALAAVAYCPPLRQLGIDLLEDPSTVTDDLTAIILDSHESELLRAMYPDHPPSALAFSVKESVVKVASPELGSYLEMLDIRLKNQGDRLVAEVPGLPAAVPCLVLPTELGLLTASFA
ncbi:hypothetical protein QVZ43_11760 [Marinobacter sp. chi1]|uniref:4'-phosphopantetheinyl transferase N-terminal domain-containing protein n=1 Tax=Marinobacter suaedae TaxID=3057675 RepID=A0ABT8W2C6_9GAMM|nr:hypothetical protein [Marinobacter sp. chi1]MDO3722399.1 hypothetical protein [Marinobacter sp. chi1]